MSKVIKSTVKRWAGSVTFYDPLTAPQVFAIEDALDETAEIEPSAFLKLKDKEVDMQWTSRRAYAYLPAIIICAEKFELKDFPEKVTKDTWPMSPRNDAGELIYDLFSELMIIYRGEIAEVPNE